MPWKNLGVRPQIRLRACTKEPTNPTPLARPGYLEDRDFDRRSLIGTPGVVAIEGHAVVFSITLRSTVELDQVFRLRRRAALPLTAVKAAPGIELVSRLQQVGNSGLRPHAAVR